MIDNSSKTEIAVLIPVYDDWDSLLKSIKSIQESICINLVIVDDGSKLKGDVDVIKDVFTCGNVHLISLPKNMGIEHALNAGLKYILEQDAYTFVARLDSGDLCVPNRFKIQYDYLQANPELKLLGSQVNFVDMNGDFIFKSKLPLTYSALRNAFYLNCYIIHPTVMFRTDLLAAIGFYPLNYKAAEDYAFFFKTVKHFKVENLNDVLVEVLINPKGISTANRKIQIKSKIKIIKDNYYVGWYPTVGIIRNVLLYLVPRSTVVFLRKLLR